MEEEIRELRADNNLEEFADVFTVFMALASECGYYLTDVLRASIDKKRERGGFEDFIVLKWVEEEVENENN
jgi:predicted house-cleaning noncanonical NTP pyrophosphatase (MazG superfamily)